MDPETDGDCAINLSTNQQQHQEDQEKEFEHEPVPIIDDNDNENEQSDCDEEDNRRSPTAASSSPSNVSFFLCPFDDYSSLLPFLTATTNAMFYINKMNRLFWLWVGLLYDRCNLSKKNVILLRRRGWTRWSRPDQSLTNCSGSTSSVSPDNWLTRTSSLNGPVGDLSIGCPVLVLFSTEGLLLCKSLRQRV